VRPSPAPALSLAQCSPQGLVVMCTRCARARPPLQIRQCSVCIAMSFYLHTRFSDTMNSLFGSMAPKTSATATAAKK
jgi:hypothetical protein